ncbi:hypothetical protein [Listeria immobilis]|nr:hypothetical protein [Listeria immobilis]
MIYWELKKYIEDGFYGWTIRMTSADLRDRVKPFEISAREIEQMP